MYYTLLFFVLTADDYIAHLVLPTIYCFHCLLLSRLDALGYNQLDNLTFGHLFILIMHKEIEISMITITRQYTNGYLPSVSCPLLLVPHATVAVHITIVPSLSVILSLFIEPQFHLM